MWNLAQAIVPGYPYASYHEAGLFNSWRSVQYPVAGYSTALDYLKLFFLAPLAGQVEPIFPYLAVSFIGSIIGLILSQERKKISPTFPRNMIFVGLVMFLSGAGGLLVNYSLIMEAKGIEAVLSTYLSLSDHRSYFSLPVAGWLFQFLFVNGGALCLTMLVMRLVEFRGRGSAFGKKTLFIRRYGFVALTVYNYQFLFFLPHLLITSLLGLKPYTRFSWGGVFLVEILGITLIQGVLLLWEKLQYVGSMEWCIGVIASRLIPSRQRSIQNTKTRLKWWEKGKLDVQGVLYEPEWLNIIEETEVNHEKQVDSKLAWKLSLLGFILFPLAILAYLIAKQSIHTENVNKFNKRAKRVAIGAIVFGVAWISILFAFTPSSLGIPL